MLEPTFSNTDSIRSRSSKGFPARSIWVIAVFALYLGIGLSMYWEVIWNGVFVIDDFDYIVNNPATADLRAFRFDLHELRLVGYLTFAINRILGGLEPTGFHLVNVLIHIGNASLVAVLVSSILAEFGQGSGEARQTPRRWWLGGALCAALFLVHPLQSQAVSYVSQRFTCLSTLFYLAAVAFYVQLRSAVEVRGPLTRDWFTWGVSIAACALAMKTKEIAFTIPFAIALLEAALFGGSRFSWRRWAFAAPYVALLAVIPLSLFAVELGLVHPTSEILENMRVAKQADLLALSPHIYLITQFRVLVLYLSLFVFPVGLRAQYDFDASRSLTEPAVLGSLCLLLAIAALGLWLWLRARTMSADRRPWARLSALGIAWFFLTASVESSAMPIKHLVFEHRMYLPSVGLFAAAIGLAALTWRPWTLRPRALAVACIALVALASALAAGTYVRNRVWTDAVLFWSDVIEKSPGLLAGWHNRAVEHRNAGNRELALADLDRGVSHVGASFRTASSWPDPDLNPENVAKVYGVRAKLLVEAGRLDQAEKDFFQVLAMTRIAMTPTLVLNVLVDIADAFRDGISCEAAIPLYSRILQTVPGTLDALYHRGWCAASLGRLEEGLTDLDAVIQADPLAAQVYFDRAAIHRDLGQFASAQGDLEAACRFGFDPACQALRRPGHGVGGPADTSSNLPERTDHGL